MNARKFIVYFVSSLCAMICVTGCVSNTTNTNSDSGSTANSVNTNEENSVEETSYISETVPEIPDSIVNSSDYLIDYDSSTDNTFVYTLPDMKSTVVSPTVLNDLNFDGRQIVLEDNLSVLMNSFYVNEADINIILSPGNGLDIAASLNENVINCTVKNMSESDAVITDCKVISLIAGNDSCDFSKLKIGEISFNDLTSIVSKLGNPKTVTCDIIGDVENEWTYAWRIMDELGIYKGDIYIKAEQETGNDSDLNVKAVCIDFSVSN